MDDCLFLSIAQLYPYLTIFEGLQFFPNLHVEVETGKMGKCYARGSEVIVDWRKN